MQTLTVKNIGASPSFIHTGTGTPRPIDPGQTLENLEFSEGEARNIAENEKVFEVKGYVARSPDDQAMQDPAETRTARPSPTVNAEIASLRAQLQEIADLFGPGVVDPANLKGAVAKLIDDAKADAGGGNGGQKLTLAEAIAKLDDKQDDDWTNAGLPDLARLGVLTGDKVTRAEVDALPEAQRRLRKTA